MCGIAGLVLPPGEVADPSRVAAAARALAHRGPDDEGFLGWNDASGPARARTSAVAEGTRVAFAHRRLAILDLSPAGWQPMSTADNRYHLVFNGEVYNYREIRSTLERLGHSFRSSGDTEVLLAALAEWGADALPRLVGMFALAFLDLPGRRVLLARDFFGIKPLYYLRLGRGWAFASEIRALRVLTGFVPRAHARRVHDYLRFGLTDHDGATMLEEVRQLEPAHWMGIPLDGGAGEGPRRFWNLERSGAGEISFAEAASRVRDLFLESVRLHLRSDVEVGSALSGGIDSSSIVSAVRHLEGEKLSLRAFTYAAGADGLDESRWAAAAAGASGASITWVRPSPRDLAADLERIVDAQEEPFGSTSIYAQHRVFAAAAAAGIKVMLDGQGADELLGGYRPFLASRAASLARRGRWSEAVRFCVAASRRSGSGLIRLLGGMGLHAAPEWLRESVVRRVVFARTPGWLRLEWFRERQSPTDPFVAPVGDDVLRAHLARAVESTSLPMLLRWEDRNSMAFSIESRVPFLTPALGAFLLSLPEEYLIDRRGTPKAIFRAAMRGLVPDSILDRQDKIGFATPERSWLLAERRWVSSILESDAARRATPLRIEAVRKEWGDFLEGRRRFDWRFWRWINFIRWSERFDVTFDGGRAS